MWNFASQRTESGAFVNILGRLLHRHGKIAAFWRQLLWKSLPLLQETHFRTNYVPFLIWNDRGIRSSKKIMGEIAIRVCDCSWTKGGKKWECKVISVCWALNSLYSKILQAEKNLEHFNILFRKPSLCLPKTFVINRPHTTKFNGVS